MTIGQRIREVRTRKGYTQKQLGDLCGMADSNIRAYELGKVHPKIANMTKIASALGVSVGYLTGDNEEEWNVLQALKNGDYRTVEKFYGFPEGTFLPISSEERERIELEYKQRQARLRFQKRMLPDSLVEAYYNMNEKGQKKAVENVQDLAKIPEYQRQEPENAGEAPLTPSEGKDTVQDD